MSKNKKNLNKNNGDKLKETKTINKEEKKSIKKETKKEKAQVLNDEKVKSKENKSKENKSKENLKDAKSTNETKIKNKNSLARDDESSKKMILLKKELIKKTDLILNLQKETNKLKEEILINNNAFAKKAKNFAKEAQDQINKFKDEYIKKHKEEIQDIEKYKSESLLIDIVEPILNLEIAISAGGDSKNSEIKSYVEGFKMILNQIIHAFNNNHIYLIKPKNDDTYNPDIHDVISGKGNKIKTVKKYGVKLHDRVIKPALIELK